MFVAMVIFVLRQHDNRLSNLYDSTQSKRVCTFVWTLKEGYSVFRFLPFKFNKSILSRLCVEYIVQSHQCKK